MVGETLRGHSAWETSRGMAWISSTAIFSSSCCRTTFGVGAASTSLGESVTVFARTSASPFSSLSDENALVSDAEN